MVNVAVLGHGVVGSGVVETLITNARHIEYKLGQPVNVKYILDIRDFSDLSYSDKFTKDFEKIVNDPEITIVAEVMGGVDPAFDYVLRSLKAGKSVVTSNKELVATKGSILLECARQNNVNFLFEASVGGGIPVIRPMHRCLCANEIMEIYGILNGTTNFILTKMVDDNMSFEDALALAQQLGYAEKDPSADVEGFDACRKICILASLAFGKHIYPEYVFTEGITAITLEDVKNANKAGYEIKLIGQASITSDNKIIAMVSPAFVKKSCLLSEVKDVYNAVMIKGNIVGDVMFYGRGAGKMPTASAVVSDIVDAASHNTTLKGYGWDDCPEENILSQEEIPCVYYINIKGVTVDQIKKVYNDIEVIDDINSVAFITAEFTGAQHYTMQNELCKMGGEILNAIRVLSI